jgi:hypothetical protein
MKIIKLIKKKVLKTFKKKKLKKKRGHPHGRFGSGQTTPVAHEVAEPPPRTKLS